MEIAHSKHLAGSRPFLFLSSRTVPGAQTSGTPFISIRPSPLLFASMI